LQVILLLIFADHWRKSTYLFHSIDFKRCERGLTFIKFPKMEKN